MLQFPDRERVSAAEILDLESGNWSPIQTPRRSPKTLERVRSGRKRFGDLFLMPYYGSGSGKTGRDINRPLGTITTRDRWAIVWGDRMRMLTKEEVRKAMGFPDGTKLPSQHKLAVHLLGNAVCPPVERDILLAVEAAA